MFTDLYREEEREEGDRGGQEDKRGKLIGERQIQPVTSSLSVLHHLEHRDSQSWVEKRRGREETETTWWRKRRVQRRREWSSQKSCSQVKLGSEVWVFTCTKLTTKTKEQRLKI